MSSGFHQNDWLINHLQNRDPIACVTMESDVVAGSDPWNPNWTGPVQTGPDWTGPDWTGPDRSRPVRTGPDRSGQGPDQSTDRGPGRRPGQDLVQYPIRGAGPCTMFFLVVPVPNDFTGTLFGFGFRDRVF